MNIEDLRSYCLSKAGTEEALPFDEDTLCFKVGGKIFAITSITDYEFVNLKCDPERAIELREKYSAIRPGWHMNKAHWNSVHVHDDISDKLVKELVDHSYDLIKSSLSKKAQEDLQQGK